MKLSIIIPMYNASRYLEACLNSIAIQQGCDYEVLLIDDGSLDDTLSLAERAAEKDERIRVFSKEHNGQGAARNKALDHAAGDYVWFVDVDDTVSPDSFVQLSEAVERDSPDIIAICGANLTPSGLRRRFSWSNVSVCTGVDVIKRNVMKDNTPFSIYRLAFLNEHRLRFLEGVYHEDTEFTPRAYYYAQKVSFINDVLYYVYLSPGSTTRSSNPKRAFDSIDIIQPSLSMFAETVSHSCRRGFDNIISSNLNHALKNSYGFDKNVNARLNECMFRHRDLFQHLKRSSILKFKVEYWVFSAFPRHTVEAYQFMQKFKFEAKQ